MNSTSYKPAGVAVESRAQTLIEAHHPHLVGIRFAIRYIFRSSGKPWVKKGMLTCGEARIVSGLSAYLAQCRDELVQDPHEPFFLITLNGDEWERWEESVKLAVLDHELCHCSIEVDEKTDEDKPALRAHDIEEFTEIIVRHGLYLPCRRTFAEACQRALQLELPGVGGKKCKGSKKP